jgi:hypothetical protein
MSPAVVAKISNQLKSFFEDSERYARSSPVLKKSAHLTQISFYKNYYRAISYYNKGLEMKKTAEEKGEGMGLAAGLVSFAMKLLTAAGKTADSSTQGAIETRMTTLKAEYEEMSLVMKNVYYESDASLKDVEAVPFESKNFTVYRSI